jgi:lipoprotein-releasing system permease protein
MYALFIAKKYMKSKKKDGFISVMSLFSMIGIMLGVATLIVVMSVMTGLRKEVMEKILGFQGHVAVYSPGKLIENSSEKLKKIEKIADVKSAHAIVEFPCLAFVGSSAQGLQGYGMSIDDIKSRPMIGKTIQSGEVSEDNVGIGELFAKKHDIKVGSILTLMSPRGHEGPFGTIPNKMGCKVGFIFKSTHRQYDANAMIFPIDMARKFFIVEKDESTMIEMFAKDPEKISLLKKQIKEIQSSDESFKNLSILDWQEANEGFAASIKVQQNVMFLILSLIILIAAFNIISSLVILVHQKKKDIAVLKTLGANRKSIMSIFFLVGARIGVMGTFYGSALGLLIAFNVDSIRIFLEKLLDSDLIHAEVVWLTHLPSVVVMSDVIWVISMSLGLSLVTTIFPSFRAASVDPIESLRYE